MQWFDRRISPVLEKFIGTVLLMVMQKYTVLSHITFYGSIAWQLRFSLQSVRGFGSDKEEEWFYSDSLNTLA